MKREIEAVECELKYSRGAVALLCVAAGATVGIVAAMPLDLPLQGALAGWAVASAIRVARRTCAPQVLRLDGSRGIQLAIGQGERVCGTVRDGSFVSPWLTLVRWRPAGAWFDRTLLVLPCMVDAEEFRRLRVVLRWA